MKKIYFSIIIFTLLSTSVFGRKYGKGYYNSYWEPTQMGDSMAVVSILPVPVFQRRADLRQYQKLIYNLKKVYPIAKFAREKLQQTEELLANVPDSKDQRQYVKQLEADLKAEYTPILKRLTFSQGKILIKLIDRETSRTSYSIIKELRGGFSAFFWQNIARIFGANLKDTYDKDGEDRMIEQLIIYYEAGLL